MNSKVNSFILFYFPEAANFYKNYIVVQIQKKSIHSTMKSWLVNVSFKKEQEQLHV